MLGSPLLHTKQVVLQEHEQDGFEFAVNLLHNFPSNANGQINKA